MENIDFRLYVITSGTTRRTISAAAAAARAGAGVVQVRAKEASAAELLALTSAVAHAVKSANPATRVLVDDRADIAYAARLAGAAVHGVHLGQEDLPVRAARLMLGPDALIGLTTGTLTLVQASRDLADVVDYLGAGPYRRTPTKESGRPPLGASGYLPLLSATSLPIVAIGGICEDDVPALAGTGVAGVAVVRAVMDASDPGAAAAGLLAAWDGRDRRVS